jgi:N-acetylglutamate synthase/N-acetylornithine aminotransferase
MAQSYPDVDIGGVYIDLIAQAGLVAIANQRVTVQAKGSQAVIVYVGGAAAPTGRQGIVLNPGQSLTGTSDHIWALGPGTVAVLVED